MKLVHAADEWLLDRFQGFSDWAHEWSGLDCLMQARVFSGLAAVCWLGVIVLKRVLFGGVDWLALFCLAVLVAHSLWETGEDRAARRAAAEGCRNPRRIRPGNQAWRFIYGFHVAWLCPLAPFVPSLCWFAGVFVCMWARVNLEACDVQTPRTGRLREALRGRRMQLQPAEVEL